jgi:hypothetical protein
LRGRFSHSDRANQVEDEQRMNPPIVMQMHWPEMTAADFERVRKAVDWEGNPPQGSRFSVAWFGDDGFRVMALWDSEKEFERFAKQRLIPGVRALGIHGEPMVTMDRAHAVFAPERNS